MGNLLADLRAITGPAHVLAEPDVVAGYATDWTRRYTGAVTCVVVPASTEESAEVVRACAGYGARITPQGGNTGLVGGSIPPARSDGQDCVILSTRRLTGLGPVDARSGQVTAGAGVTIAQLAGHAAAAGFRYGVDLAVTGLGHRRRHDRDQRGRHPHDQVRADQGTGGRADRGAR